MYLYHNSKRERKILNTIKSYYKNKISAAIAQGYQTIAVPIDCSCEPYCFNDYDENYIYELAYDFGWFQFAIIDFETNNISIIDLEEVGVA